MPSINVNETEHKKLHALYKLCLIGRTQRYLPSHSIKKISLKSDLLYDLVWRLIAKRACLIAVVNLETEKCYIRV